MGWEGGFGPSRKRVCFFRSHYKSCRNSLPLLQIFSFGHYIETYEMAPCTGFTVLSQCNANPQMQVSA